MFKWLTMLWSVAVLAGCDQDLSQKSEVVIDGRAYSVYPARNHNGVWYASPSDRSAFFNPFPGVRTANIRAIEAVTGCEVLPETINQIDPISTDAAVSCS